MVSVNIFLYVVFSIQIFLIDSTIIDLDIHIFLQEQMTPLHFHQENQRHHPLPHRHQLPQKRHHHLPHQMMIFPTDQQAKGKANIHLFNAQKTRKLSKKDINWYSTKKEKKRLMKMVKQNTFIFSF